MNQALFDSISASSTALIAEILWGHGYQSLSEALSQTPAYRKYYVTRNISSLIVFHLPEQDFPGFLSRPEIPPFLPDFLLSAFPPVPIGIPAVSYLPICERLWKNNSPR